MDLASMDGHSSVSIVSLSNFAEMVHADQLTEPTLINLALDNTTQVVFTSANLWDNYCNDVGKTTDIGRIQDGEGTDSSWV
jgi:hypothetical protein